MRHLSKTATKQLEKLLAQLPVPEEGYHSHVKVDNAKGLFMPVSVEVIAKYGETGWSRHIAVAHYHEQNGDAMRDPEIVLAEYVTEEGERLFHPVSYRQDSIGVNREYVRFDNQGKPTHLVKRLQEDCARFCNDWMLNIKRQQGL